MDFSLAATDSGPLYTSVFYCGDNIFFTLNLSGSWRNYIIMVIGAIIGAEVRLSICTGLEFFCTCDILSR